MDDDLCCSRMEEYVNDTCEEHGPDCPERIIKQFGRTFVIPVRDGGDSGIVIHYCPWCGYQLSAGPIDDSAALTEQVAMLKLPWKVSSIGMNQLANALESQYGLQLMMHQRGSFMVVSRPAKGT